MRGRRYQKYVYGEKLDCSHWKHAYDLCNKYVNRKDIEALVRTYIILAAARENLTLLYTNNKGADQTAHLGSLVCLFVNLKTFGTIIKIIFE